jgi:ribosomal-protein-alanine N-acetyltransferase
MTLTTDRLVLRNFYSTDWERVHVYGADPDFSKFELWGPNTAEDTQKFIAEMVEQAASQPRYKFGMAVCLKQGGALIGSCGIRRESELSLVANLGWAITPEQQKKGYATEAAQALLDFGFHKLNLSVIYATCDSRNAASYRVMEKLGMARVGLIHGTKEIKGYVRDSYRYEKKNAVPFLGYSAT